MRVSWTGQLGVALPSPYRTVPTHTTRYNEMQATVAIYLAMPVAHQRRGGGGGLGEAERVTWAFESHDRCARHWNGHATQGRHGWVDFGGVGHSMHAGDLLLQGSRLKAQGSRPKAQASQGNPMESNHHALMGNGCMCRCAAIKIRPG
ncbi:hypothetical protein IAQ61_007901 [Plenodomus lingam]|uniref:uncharacterized protein n=1 Tax=Leptosphaeria maculans TaxID=5022 RepID=UPI0033327A2E|nr:hypothetical protein IAQ61_007901 [Plenodomus lingam]